MTRFHLHLVSDATGDTVHSVARACLVQFEDAEAIEHIWSMVRTKMQMERVIHGIEANPGVVLFTLVDEGLRSVLQEGCRKLQVSAIPVLDPVLAVLASVAARCPPGVGRAGPLRSLRQRTASPALLPFAAARRRSEGAVDGGRVPPAGSPRLG